MNRTFEIKKAAKVIGGDFVLVPQNGIGVLLAHAVTGTEPGDGGKWIEIATDDGMRHLVGKDQRVVVVV